MSASASGAAIPDDAPTPDVSVPVMPGGAAPDISAFGRPEVRAVYLTDVGHTFDRVGEDMLFQHLTLTLLPRHVYALTGPSGSGKSTLLSIIAGWTKPYAGEVERVGCGRVAWVLQNPHGVARRAALDHVTLPFIARGKRRRDAELHAQELLDAFGLAEVANKPFKDLSGGEAQRLMLARGVASGAGLLLVDEPTAQLDLTTAATVNERLNNLSMSGAIVVIATHDPRARDACTDLIDLRNYQGDDSSDAEPWQTSRDIAAQSGEEVTG